MGNPVYVEPVPSTRSNYIHRINNPDGTPGPYVYSALAALAYSFPYGSVYNGYEGTADGRRGLVELNAMVQEGHTVTVHHDEPKMEEVE